MQDLVDTRLAQKISQLPGVGLVSLCGGQRPAVRIQAESASSRAYGLNLDDLRTTIGNANVNTPRAVSTAPTRAYTINANDQLRDAGDYKIADRRLQERRAGAADRRRRRRRRRREQQARRLDERSTPAIILNVQRQPGANVIAVVDAHQDAAAAAAGRAARRRSTSTC